MNPETMKPYGKALLDYYNGNKKAEIIVRRDDGYESVLPVSVFFRSADELLPGEIEALDQCRGHVLDIGAGSGIHALILQSRGLIVSTLDIEANAVNIMIRRGIQDVDHGDIMRYQGGPFDTLLLLGHGIGMVENIKGLRRFLDHAAALIRGDGQLIINSVDVRCTDDPLHLKYHEQNTAAGRYIGETRIQFEYKEEVGPYCAWLHIDAPTLQKEAEKWNWCCEIIFQDNNGEYLARLFQKGSA